MGNDGVHILGDDFENHFNYNSPFKNSTEFEDMTQNVKKLI